MSLVTAHRGGAAALAGAVLLSGLSLAGCEAGHAVKKISHPAAGNHLVASTPVAAGKGSVRAFIAELQAGAATPFEAKYLISGKRAAEIVYAIRPPDGLLIKVTSVGRGKRTQILANGAGEYRCQSPGTGPARWTCQRLGRASAAAQNKAFAVYTAGHWAAYLKTVALAAGTMVTTPPMPAAGSGMTSEGARDARANCISFRPAGATGFSVICAAAPGVLGSVILCTGPTSFLLESYGPAPPATLFQVPPGARITG
jgi:hypothetical protein